MWLQRCRREADNAIAQCHREADNYRREVDNATAQCHREVDNATAQCHREYNAPPLHTPAGSGSCARALLPLARYPHKGLSRGALQPQSTEQVSGHRGDSYLWAESTLEPESVVP